MKNKALYIGLGVAALGGVAYFMMRKKTSDASASDDMETKSAEASEPTASTTSASSKGSALTKDRPAAPSCGCGTGQIPCPNQRCASKTQVAPTAAAPSTLSDEAFALLGITKADNEKMQAQERIIKEAFPRTRDIGKRVRLLAKFAEENKISMTAFLLARKALRAAANNGSISPQTDGETENFAFNLTF